MLFCFKNIILSLIYSLVFILGYIFFLNKYFEYMGFILLDNIDKRALIISILISIIPVYFYRGIKSPSSFIAVFIYFLLYIPIIITFALVLNQPYITNLCAQSMFMLGMCLIFFADRIVIKTRLSVNIRVNMFKVILILTVVSSIYMLIVYHGNLRLVSFDDVYEQRAANVALGRDIITSYLSSWLASVMIPICLTYSLFEKKKIYFIVGFFACLIIFMATADKIVIMYPFVSVGFYYLFSKNKIQNSYIILGLTFIIFMLITIFIDFNIISSLFWMRTIGNGGLLTSTYFDFFSTHPKTYYSHINLVNAITHAYPYGDKGLGQVIGQYYWSDDLNANANFWATDGIAALGMPGILSISIFVFAVFVVLNNVTKHHDKLFVIMCLIPFLSSMLNMSFFSSLLTNGGLLIILFFIFVKKNEATEKNKLINI